jgi:hypothetical protein
MLSRSSVSAAGIFVALSLAAACSAGSSPANPTDAAAKVRACALFDAAHKRWHAAVSANTLHESDKQVRRVALDADRRLAAATAMATTLADDPAFSAGSGEFLRGLHGFSTVFARGGSAPASKLGRFATVMTDGQRAVTSACKSSAASPSATPRHDVAVPSLHGLRLATAQSVLTRRGLLMGRITYVHSHSRRATVIRQFPAAGLYLRTGQPVSVSISDGPWR